MNKKLNLSLNIIESVLVVLTVIIGGYFYLTEAHYNLLANSFIALGCMIIVALIVSIELFLLYLLSNKYKLISLGYYLGIALLVMISNIYVPFFGLILLIIANIIKNYYRIQNREMVYSKEQLYELCDLFNIKIKKERKKRTTVSKTTKKTVKTTATKKQTVPAKKATKSYA